MENKNLMSWHVPKTEEEVKELKALAEQGDSRGQADYSVFTEEDLCQLFWDLGDALEKSLGVIRNLRVAHYYFNMLAEWGHPEGGERRKNIKKFLFFWYRVK